MRSHILLVYIYIYMIKHIRTHTSETLHFHWYFPWAIWAEVCCYTFSDAAVDSAADDGCVFDLLQRIAQALGLSNVAWMTEGNGDRSGMGGICAIFLPKGLNLEGILYLESTCKFDLIRNVRWGSPTMWQHVSVPTFVEFVVISCSVSLRRLDSFWSWRWIAIAVARNSSTTLSPARVDYPYHPLKSERWWMRHNLGLWVVVSFTEKGARSNPVAATYSPCSAIPMGSATTRTRFSNF